MTNSERRISRVRRAVAPPGQARADWAVATGVARRVEARLRPGMDSLFPYLCAEQVWNEHRATTHGRDLDITGLSYELLERDGPQFWPFPEGARSGRARLFGDQPFATASGRARFAPVPFVAPVEPADARYPLSLTTGRLRDQWHGMSRTGTIARLFGHAAEPCVQLHPTELERRGLADGDLVRITSRRGTLVLPAQASDEVRGGQAFIAMHWGAEVLGGADGRGARWGINHLTLDAIDAASGQPELKHAAVAVEPARLGWHYCVFGRVGPARWLALQQSLRAHFAAFGYCACVPLWSGDDDDGALLLRAAAAQPVDPARLDAIEAEFGLAQADTLRYDDPRRAARRRIRTDGAQLVAVAVGGDAAARAAESWLRELFMAGLPAGVAPIQLMSSARPAAALGARGRVVCSCLDVGEQKIREFLAGYAGADPAGALGAALKCGTECGSCRPELQRIADEVRSARREDLRPLLAERPL